MPRWAALQGFGTEFLSRHALLLGAGAARPQCMWQQTARENGLAKLVHKHHSCQQTPPALGVSSKCHAHACSSACCVACPAD